MLLITKYGCFLEIGYVAMDLIPILLILGSLPLAHNAQHSLVIMQVYTHIQLCLLSNVFF